jgi:hypothetical protein
MSSASVFSADVQDLSKEVKKEVRNEWSHVNFSNWDETKFESSFNLMDSLVRALNLPHDDEKKISYKLADWQNQGKLFNNNEKI